MHGGSARYHACNVVHTNNKLFIPLKITSARNGASVGVVTLQYISSFYVECTLRPTFENTLCRRTSNVRRASEPDSLPT